MIALDTNVLIYALVKSQPEHDRVATWVTGPHESLATTHTNIAETLRLLTHPRIFPHPLTLIKAIPLLTQFLEDFEVKVLEESDTWWLELLELCKMLPGLRGNETFDARIALCLRFNGIREIVTYDADFAKYPFLKMIKP